MISAHVLFLTPYLAGLMLSLGIAVSVRTYRENASARLFFWKVILESLVIAGFILETVSPTLPEKVLWDDAQYVLDVAIPGLAYLFVMSLFRRDVRPLTGYLLVLAPPAVTAALMATNSVHHLIRPWTFLRVAPVFPELLYPITTVQAVLIGYLIVFFVINESILFSSAARSSDFRRRQSLAVGAAFLIPLVGSLLTVFGVQVGPYRDMTPMTFSLQNLVIVLALSRFALFSMVPVARDHAIEHMDVSVFVEDLKQRVVDVNRAGLEATGLTAAEVVGRPTEDVFPFHIEELRRIRGVDETIFEVEGRRPANIGRTFEVHVSTARDRRGRKIGRLLLVQDITAHKILADDLAKTRDLLAARLADLERAQEELLRRERLSTLGRTVATVSHEIRNPLAAVRNALFSLHEGFTSGDAARIERSFTLAERNIRRCDAIIVELLDSSRARQPVLEETDVDPWLAGVLDELEAPRCIAVSRKLESRARARLNTERMRRAVVNVHSNAVQAMTEEGAHGGTLTVESRLADGRVQLAFRDTGTGMSPEVLSRAGEPLYSTKSYGVGLGLSIVRDVMKEHGGLVRIESAPGKGTVVVLELEALG